MTTFDVQISKKNKKMRMSYKKNIGRIDIDNDGIQILHRDYLKEIKYDEIDKINRIQGRVQLFLKNGEYFDFVDAKAYNLRFGDIGTIIRSGKMIENLLREYMGR